MGFTGTPRPALTWSGPGAVDESGTRSWGAAGLCGPHALPRLARPRVVLQFEPGLPLCDADGCYGMSTGHSVGGKSVVEERGKGPARLACAQRSNAFRPHVTSSTPPNIHVPAPAAVGSTEKLANSRSAVTCRDGLLGIMAGSMASRGFSLHHQHHSSDPSSPRTRSARRHRTHRSLCSAFFAASASCCCPACDAVSFPILHLPLVAEAAILTIPRDFGRIAQTISRVLDQQSRFPCLDVPSLRRTSLVGRLTTY